MEAKMKHLELIQGVINRMSGSLFYLKGWTITLIAAISAISQKDASQDYFYIALFPVAIFWIMDGYFLSHERMFRDLYEDVAKIKNDSDVTFSMDIREYKKLAKNTWTGAMFSKTLYIFYGLIFLMMVVLKCVTNGCWLPLFCLK
jgi:hypothetical protein